MNWNNEMDCGMDYGILKYAEKHFPYQYLALLYRATYLRTNLFIVRTILAAAVLHGLHICVLLEVTGVKSFAYLISLNRYILS